MNVVLIILLLFTALTEVEGFRFLWNPVVKTMSLYQTLMQ